MHGSIGKGYARGKSYAGGGVIHLGARWEELYNLSAGRRSYAVGIVMHWEELRTGKSYELRGFTH